MKAVSVSSLPIKCFRTCSQAVKQCISSADSSASHLFSRAVPALRACIRCSSRSLRREALRCQVRSDKVTKN